MDAVRQFWLWFRGITKVGRSAKIERAFSRAFSASGGRQFLANQEQIETPGSTHSRKNLLRLTFVFEDETCPEASLRANRLEPGAMKASANLVGQKSRRLFAAHLGLRAAVRTQSAVAVQRGSFEPRSPTIPSHLSELRK